MAGYSSDDIPPPKADFSAPPPYEAATKLPTYEEVQREKHLEDQTVLTDTRVSRDIPIVVFILYLLFISRNIGHKLKEFSRWMPKRMKIAILVYWEPILCFTQRFSVSDTFNIMKLSLLLYGSLNLKQWRSFSIGSVFFY